MKRWKKILLGAAVTVVVAILFSIVHHHQLKAAVARYRAELKAKGELLTVAEVVPPSLPPEKNSAPLLTNAISLLTTNASVLDTNRPSAMRMVATGKAMIGWAQLDIRDYYGGTNSWQEIEAALAYEKSALNLLRQLPEKPVFDFKLDYSDGFSKLEFSPLLQVKKEAQRLIASAVSSLHHNDGNAAAKDLQTMLSLVNGLSNDRVLISELVRMAIAQMAMAGNWELLQSPNVTEDQLDVLQSQWMGLEFIQSFENAMRIERALGAIEAMKMRDLRIEKYFGKIDVVEFYDADEGYLPGLKKYGHALRWVFWRSYPDELRYLQGIQAVLDATRQARTNYAFYSVAGEIKKRNETLGISVDDEDYSIFGEPAKSNSHYIISSSIGVFEKGVEKVLIMEAARQLTITAIALKRFQLKHGHLPEKLAELPPEFLSAVPLDPVDGQPLRYRRNADGSFLLYSIGEDGKDDGGDARPPGNSKSLQWQQGRDWVWPQPATPQEVADFFARSAK